jgi:alpha-glucosidase
VQTGDPTSTLELYRSALAIRAEHPALGAGDGVEWLDAPAGALAFRRNHADGAFVCVANTGSSPVRLPVPGRLLLTSGEEPGRAGAETVIPADTTVWWSV